MQRNERHAPALPEAASRFAMQLSVAGQGVEVLALTADQGLLDTLREAVGEQQRIWHAHTTGQAVELIMAGNVGVVLLDTLVTGTESASFCEDVRAQFPDLVLVVAGTTEDQTRLVKHITTGDIYRFLHKPISAARARQFIEAGVRRHLDGRTFIPTGASSNSGLRSPLVLGGIAIGVIAIIATAVALFSGNGEPQPQQTKLEPRPAAAPSGVSAPPRPEIPSAPVIEPSAQRKLTPPVAEPKAERPPAPAEDTLSSAEAGRFLKQAEEALIAGRLDEAARHLSAARRIDADHAGLAFLNAQLDKETQKRAAEEAAAKAREEEQAAQARAAAEQEEAERKVTAEREAAAERERQAAATNIVLATSIPRTKQVQPMYPPDALRKNVEGWVDLNFTVAVDGRVKDIETHGAEPPGVFEAAARSALAQWRFKPVVKDGAAVEQRAFIRLRFAVTH